MTSFDTEKRLQYRIDMLTIFWNLYRFVDTM